MTGSSPDRARSFPALSSLERAYSVGGVEQIEIQQLLVAARRAGEAGRPEEAARLYHQILAGAGEQAGALNALGMMSLTSGDHAAAVGWFRRSISADPQSPDLQMNLATAYRRLGDATGERAALEGALSLDQRHFMALVRLAELHERTGENALAAERWRGVVAMGAMIDERSPALDELLARARDYVARDQARFAAVTDEGLAALREEFDARETRRFDACINHVLGRRSIYINQCAGMHFPFLPADEFFDREHFPWLEEIEAKTAIIRAELEAILAEEAGVILPYVNMKSGTPANKWTALDGSLAWGALHLWKDGKRNEAACARAPRTAEAVAALPLSDLPGSTPTVFFSILRPGAHLPAHTGVSNVRSIVHLPLIVPQGCEFRVGGETRAWEEGKAWVFDDTIEHEAWNRSDHARAILIFDVWNPYISETERKMLRKFHEISLVNRDLAGQGISVSD